jgi:predicted nucleic acid-binding protein
MAGEVARQYWDSCVFLSYINETPNRVENIASLLADAEHATLEIITSVLTIAEVAFGAEEQTKHQLDPAVEARINRLWEPASPVHLVEVYSTIAEDARSLMRAAVEKGWSLKAYDALHLCAARRFEAATFVTYDDALVKYGEAIGIPVGQPVVGAPRLPFAASGDSPEDTPGI